MGFLDDLEDVTKGAWGFTKEVGKFAVKAGAVAGAGAMIVSTGGAAAPIIGGATYLIGKGIKKIGEEEDVDVLEDIGDFIEDVGLDGLTGGIFNFGTKTAGHLAAREIAKNGKRMTTGAKVLIGIGKTIKIGSQIYEFHENIEHIARGYHGSHKERGFYYDDNCPICRGDI